ncbi:MAG TPA: hypothetical protein VK054_10910, partial [Beutenbergiaceae bacterium]|nr:hypothetical protein [Beutenbergiaceae bacterium]
SDIANVDSDEWVDEPEDLFTVGDDVWYRIQYTPFGSADIRNGVITDFLPAGVSLRDVVIAPSDPEGSVGGCSEKDILENFIPRSPSGEDEYDDAQILRWELGSDSCYEGEDRFYPAGVDLNIYVHVTIEDQPGFGVVDLNENLVKYQQQNVHGEVFFLRDDAVTNLAQSARLLKGIESINEDSASKDGKNGEDFNSNIDGLEVVQGDDVTFRLDITAPEVGSNGYVVYDALPEGITAADVKNDSYTVNTIDGATSEAVTDGWSAHAYDPGHNDYPSDLDGAYDGQSVIVWRFDDVDVPANEAGGEDNGVSLGYTLTIPDGDDDAGALVGQEYANTAGIVSFEVDNNAEGTSTLVPTGNGAIASPDIEDSYEVSAEDTSDPSDVFLPHP